MEVLIAKDTAAGSKSAYFINASATRPITLQVDGDLSSDEITIKGAGIDPTNETTLYDQDGVALVLSATKPVYTFYAPLRVNIAKGITSNAVGVMELKL